MDAAVAALSEASEWERLQRLHQGARRNALHADELISDLLLSLDKAS
jgi:hypothetical protein